MLHPEIERIDIEVQTSLEYLNPETRGEVEEELRKLRDDKSLLEGKIRGYLTLSEICHEYKEELSKLRQEYSKLLDKVNSHSSSGMSTKQHRSESPTPDNDLGPVNGHGHEQRTHSHDPKHHHSFSSTSLNNVNAVASNILKERDLPVRTKELFDFVEDPPKSSEGTKSMPHSVDSMLPYRDKFPMQESIAEETSQSVTGLGFEHVPSDDMTLGQSAGNMRPHQSGDLMNFSVPHARAHSSRKQIPVTNDDPDIENILKSVQLDSDRVELRKVIFAVKSYSDAEHLKLQRANQILVDENNEQQKRIRQAEDDNRRLVERVRTLEQQLYDLSNSIPRSMTPRDSHQASGWVHVEKLPQNEHVAKTTEPQQKAASNHEDIETLKQKNQQLTEANQRWSNEWTKLLAHYENRITDLQTERDRMVKEMTDLKISEESKQRDYEKMLMNSKKKAGDEENAKEEAFLQLTSANNRVEALQLQLAESEDTISALRREKQVLETELSVIRQRPVTSTASAPQASRTGKPQMELQTENDVLRQQLLVFQEDFDRERQDRAKAQSVKDDYKKQNEQYKKRVRHLEQKNINFDRQIKNVEESNKRLQDEKITLQQEIANLKMQLQRELEKNRNLIPRQVPYQPPLIQSAGMQPQRQVIFGQQVQQPRPQQFVVPPTYDQRVPHISNGMAGYNMMPPGTQYQQQVPQQGVVNPPAPYYQANQAGKQTEFRVGAWSCGQCTYVNYPGRTVCEMCGYIQSPSTNQNFTYRPTGNETLQPRGDPHQQQQQQQPQYQQQQQYGYAGGPATQRDVTTDNINYL